MSWMIYKGADRENLPKSPYVSITPKGRIAINSVLSEEIASWKYVELMWDDEREVLAIKIVREKLHKGICVLTHCKAGRIITCKGILNEFEIRIAKPTKFQAQYINKNRAIHVYLRKPIGKNST